MQLLARVSSFPPGAVLGGVAIRERLWGDTRLRTSYGQGHQGTGLEQFLCAPILAIPGNPTSRAPSVASPTYAGFEQLLDSDKLRLSAITSRIAFAISSVLLLALLGLPAVRFRHGNFNTDPRPQPAASTSRWNLAPSVWLATYAGNYSYDDTARFSKSANPFATRLSNPQSAPPAVLLSSAELSSSNVGWPPHELEHSLGYFNRKNVNGQQLCRTQPTALKIPGLRHVFAFLPTSIHHRPRHFFHWPRTTNLFEQAISRTS